MQVRGFLAAALAATPASAVAIPPSNQDVLGEGASVGIAKEKWGVGHFSEWSRETKRQFLMDWQAEKAHEWVFVQGNEAGDLDSMTSALTWAYHLSHSTQNTSDPIKAISLLQTPKDALDLRPENTLALHNSKMTPEHADLLTIEELPEDPDVLARKLRGIVLVDHPEPLPKWSAARILSIFDHHADRGKYPDAKPRIFEKTASCTTIVARQMLDELEKLPKEYHMPHELLELVLGAIAFDSNGLKDATDADLETSKRVLGRSRWQDKKLKKTMKKLEDELETARDDIDHLGVRDLLRRDWKNGLIDTPSPRTPTVNVGYASVPYSLEEQIEKTEFSALFDWFAIEAAWTAEVNSDITVSLNKYKVKDKNGDKQKIREIVLTVRDDERINEEQADSLFKTVYEAIESNEQLKVKRWHDKASLGRRQMAWINTCEDCGRKVVRPIIEDAVASWDMPEKDT